MTMKLPPPSRSLASAVLRCRALRAALVLPLVAIVFSPVLQAQTSAVPDRISYQGRVTAANGTPIGASVANGGSGPVNRLVIFRVWGHQSNSTVSDLLYSEQQTVTISEGEFSVLVGQGNAVVGTPLGYSETTKGPGSITLATATVFGAATRYLGVTVDDGTTTADPELSPRQQVVATAFAFRAKFAESLGANGGSSLTALDNGNVGIGTATPSVRLDVAGQEKITTDGTSALKIVGSGNNTNPAEIVFDKTVVGAANVAAAGFASDRGAYFWVNGSDRLNISTNGNVGVGTISPSQKLHVVGNTYFDGNVGIGTSSPLTRLHVAGTGDVEFGLQSTDAVANASNTDGDGRRWTLQSTGSAGSASVGKFQIIDRTANASRLTIDRNGSVGIGTTSPLSRLQITNAGDAEFGLQSSDTSGRRWTFQSSGAGGNVGKFQFVDRTAGAHRLVIDTVGNVGLGTDSPAAKLHVEGSTYLNGNVGIGTSSPSQKLHVEGTSYLNGSVGIGTSSPGKKLHIRGAGDVEFGVESSDTNGRLWTFQSSAGAQSGIFQIIDRTAPNGGAARLAIDTSGNVGIGTTSPAAKLDVAGGYHMNSSGTFSIDSSAAFPIITPITGASARGTSNGTAGTSAANITGGRFFISTDGKIGIGTNTPETSLHIANRGTKLGLFYRGAAVENNGTGDRNDPDYDYSLTTTNFDGGRYTGLLIDARIRASALDVTVINIDSDRRIKRIVGRSSAAKDLETFLRLQITDYNYKDPALHGTKPQKKLIAQEVEEVFPQAVSRGVGIIPDIYQFAEQKEGWVALPTDLKSGDRVRLIGDIGGMAMYEVLEVQPGRFRIDYKQPDEKVFVYGREVRDFRALDYEAIAMLNVSATQEIKREKDAEVAALREQNAALTTQVAALNQRLAEVNQSFAALDAKDRARDAKMASIEKLLQSTQTVMARPAATPRANANGQE